MSPTPDEPVTPDDVTPADGGDPLAALLGGGGGGFDFGALMEQAGQMQAQLVAAQEQAAATEVEGSAGGGKVRVTITGDFLPVGVKLDRGVVDPDDTEL